MPNTRKRIQEARDYTATVDMENTNSNHVETVTKSHKLDMGAAKVDKKQPKSKVLLNESKKKQNSACKAQFKEDQDMVDMEVDPGSTISDGEIDPNSDSDHSSDNEVEKQSEQRSLDSESDCEINDQKSENKTENDSQNDQESTDEEEIKRKSNEKHKRKQERRDRRASMEQKLDTLSNTLEVMRGLMKRKRHIR